jgi:hypothetical protein
VAEDEHVHVRRLLERDLVDESDRPELRLIWADLLQLAGDPLGRLIVLDHMRLDPGTPASRAEYLTNEAADLRRMLGPRMWSEWIPEVGGVTFDWRLGFVHTLEIDADQLSNDQTPTARVRVWDRNRARTGPATASDTIAWLLPILVRQPALRWLERIRITIDDELALAGFGWIAQAQLPNPILREIHIGRPPKLRTRPGGTHEPRRSQGWAIHRAAEHGLRQLRVVSVAGERVRLACYDGNHQARVHYIQSLATRELTVTNKTTLARGLWDESSLVQRVAFDLARELGPRAEFLLPDLVWFLRPPLGKSDPRPSDALQILAAIGPDSVAVLAEALHYLARPEDWISPKQPNRVSALVAWIAGLGPVAHAAEPLLQSLCADQHAIAAPTRAAITRALQAITPP